MHDKVVSAVDCILSLVGDKNPEHYFVATQDSGLRAKLREVPCVPVIYGLKNSLFVEQPSVQQRPKPTLLQEKETEAPTVSCSKSDYTCLIQCFNSKLGVAWLMLSCEHEKVVSAVDCILSLVGDKNPEHYFVATQDSNLRAKLREVPCVPVIYGLKNSLFIEQPSVQQRKFAQLDEEKRPKPTLLQEKETEAPTVSCSKSDYTCLIQCFNSKLGVAWLILRCRTESRMYIMDDGEAKRKRVRKRKRSGKDSSQAETAS
uniref:PIN domain-containing protein n=1 Tax=Aegilops tauschii TaxID=37682 RepID=M8BM63_AEGTA